MRFSYILILSALIVLTPITAYSQETTSPLQEEEKQSKISVLNENHSIRKMVNLGDKFNWDFTTAEIVNIGNETAIIKEIKKSQFFLKNESYKLSKLSIDSDSIFTNAQLPISIEPRESTKIKITSDVTSKLSGTFSGKLLLMGNFEPQDVKLDVIIKQNPEELMGFTVMGIVFAGFLSFMLKIGINYFKDEKGKSRKEKASKVKDSAFISLFQFTVKETKEEEVTKPEPGKILLQLGYSMVVALVAIPATLFVQGVLTGNPNFDSFIAIGIGAGIYGSKDLIGELKAK